MCNFVGARLRSHRLCYEITIAYHFMWHFMVTYIILCYEIVTIYHFKYITSSHITMVFILFHNIVITYYVAFWCRTLLFSWSVRKLPIISCIIPLSLHHSPIAHQHLHMPIEHTTLQGFHPGILFPDFLNKLTIINIKNGGPLPLCDMHNGSRVTNAW
jgi:hypothetical protein